MLSGQDEKCPIATFLRYKRMLPPGCNHLFPKPLKSPTAAGCYFSKQSIGHNKLGSMMSTLSEKAQLSRKYTNHCLRATPVHLLDSANIPSRHIMTVTGHKAESSLKTYTGFTDQKTKKAMSHTISKSLGLDVHGSSSKTVVPPEQNNLCNDEPVLGNIDFLDIDNSTLEPLSNSQFDNIMMEFNAPNDPIDAILKNLPEPSYELNRRQSSCDSVMNYQSNRDSVINYQSSSHAVQSLPAPIISGASANVTINYNFYNGPGK